MLYSESVFMFSWHTDIKHIGIQFGERQSPIPISWIARLPPIAEPMVQIDPDSYIQLSKKVRNKEKWFPTLEVWLKSIDRYLCQYFHLVEQRYHGANRDICVAEQGLLGKLENYERSRTTKKELYIPEAMYPHKIRGKCMPGSIELRTQYFCNASILNLYLKSVCSRTAPSQENFVYFTGTRFAHDEAVPLIGNFEIEDYIMHERLTAISFSIELTAALFEIKDLELRDAVFNEMKKELLIQLLYSPLIFTRIGIARNFIHEIQIQYTIWEHQLVSQGVETFYESDIWEEIVTRALFSRQVVSSCLLPGVDIYPKGYICDVLDEELEDAIAHLKSLLAMVVEPVNIVEYAKNPQYEMVAFCNPEHEHVKYFLNKLVEARNFGINSRPRAELDLLFAKVYDEVSKILKYRVK